MDFLKKLSAVRFAGKVNLQHQHISLLDDVFSDCCILLWPFLFGPAAQISSVLL